MEVTMSLNGADQFSDSIDELAGMFQSSQNYIVYNDVEHAYYQEFGTVNHPPQPHFRPAIQHAGGQMGQVAQQVDTLDALLSQTADTLVQDAQRRAPVLTGELRSGYTKDTA